jgi:hypothetical protein
LYAKANEVRQLGRPITSEDVQAAVNVPADYAAKLAAQLAATNGYTVHN